MNPLSQPVEKAIFRLLEDLATPRSLSVSMLIDHGEWDQLVNLTTDPRTYLNAGSYWRDTVATNLLKKCRDLPTSIDKRQVAVDAFWASENMCARSNDRLNSLLDEGASPYSERLVSFVRAARGFIDRVLGPCPTVLDGRFGPGSTFGDRGQLCTIPDKMSSEPTLTGDAWPFLIQWSGTLWAKACSSSPKEVDFVPGNRFVTVPKDATKDRGIAIEPSINVFYQLAYGRLIRERLKRQGVDLDRGQDIHKRLARESSSSGRLATLDLSNASDTIAKVLVKLLLPSSWFEWLDALRSKKTLINDQWVLLEKFSSMGNGFTFELETLLFLSLVQACCPGSIVGVDVLAYGDDILYPVEHSNDVMSCLSFFGLVPNMKKTFSTGPFRESCGGDFFAGVDVRPFQLKESPHEPHQLISFLNGLYRLSRDNLGRAILVHRARVALLDGLPSSIRACRGPEILGDLVINDDDKDTWSTRTRHGIREFRCWRPIYREIGWWGFSDEVLLATS